MTLVSEPKLRLNRNNDAYYRNFLVPLKHPLPKRGFKASEHRLRKAFEWFDRRLRSHVRAEEDPGRAIAELVDRMSDRLFFTVITVTDELNAYLVDRIGAGSVPDFVRCHWMSRHGPVRRSDRFKTVRREIRDAGAVYALLEELERGADIGLRR